MTPAINSAKKARIPFTLHEYDHDPANEAWGLEASEKLNVSPDRVFKTLVTRVDGGELVVALVPVCAMLSMKQVARGAGGKKAVMADKRDVERATGYVLGGVSPLGQKKRLRTLIDESAQTFATLYVSAGRRGLEIELAPADLAQLTGASFVALKG